MILWGNDFQPEGLWIAAVWEFREQTLIYCCSSLHLMHTISILKIMVFSNLTISAPSLCLPAILFSLSAVSVGVWCSSETDTLLFGFLVCLVETLGYSRNDNKHKLLYMRNRSWNSEALKHENYALICGLHHLPCAYALSMPLLYIIARLSWLIFLPHPNSLMSYQASLWDQSLPLGVCSWLLPGPCPISPALQFCYFLLCLIWAVVGAQGLRWQGWFSCSLFWCSEPQSCPAAKKGIIARKVLSNPQKKQALEAPKWSEIKADRLCRGFSPKG